MLRKTRMIKEISLGEPFNTCHNVLCHLFHQVQCVFMVHFNLTVDVKIKLTVNTQWCLAHLIHHLKSLILALLMGDSLILMCFGNSVAGRACQHFE